MRPGREGCQCGEKVTVVGLWDSDEEARMVGDRIEHLRRGGHALAEIAILVRAGFQTRAFEERLITLGVPYRVVGGLRFYERARRSATPSPICAPLSSRPTIWRSSASSMCRVVASATRRCGRCTKPRACSAFRLHAAAARLLETGGLKGKVREAIGGLLRELRALAGHAGASMATS